MDDHEVAIHVADDRAVSDDVAHPKVSQPEGRRRRGNLGEQVESGCFGHTQLIGATYGDLERSNVTEFCNMQSLEFRGQRADNEYMNHADTFKANRNGTGYYTGTEMRALDAAHLLDEIEEVAAHLAELKAEHAAILADLAD